MEHLGPKERQNMKAQRLLKIKPEITYPTFHRREPRVREAGSKEHGADMERLTGGKYLINPDYVRKLNSTAVNLRNLIKRHSIAWYDDGTRAIPISRVEDCRKLFQRAIEDCQAAHRNAIKAYQREYEKHEARESLGTLYDADQYLPPDIVARGFSVDVTYSPMTADVPATFAFQLEPGQDGRLTIDANEAEAIRDAVVKEWSAKERAARDEISARISESIDRFSEKATRRLAGKDKKFYRQSVADFTESLEFAGSLFPELGDKLEALRATLLNPLTHGSGCTVETVASDISTTVGGQEKAEKIKRDADSAHDMLKRLFS